MRTENGIAVPNVDTKMPLYNPGGYPDTDIYEAGGRERIAKRLTPDDADFLVVAGNFHVRMAEIVRRLEVWNAAENTMEDGLWDIVNDATALWHEYQETVNGEAK